MNKNAISNINISSSLRLYYLLCLGLFIFSPFIGAYVIMAIAAICNNKKFAKPILLYLTGLTFLIETTRSFSLDEPSDWPAYYEMFVSAGTIRFSDYIFLEHDIIWSIINYLFFHFITDRFIVFASIIVAATFGILGLAIYKYWSYTNTSIRYLVVAFSFCFFFNEFIGISNNLLRQQFAMSILYYALCKKYITGKIPWILIILVFNIHSMTAIFFPFFFIPLNKQISSKTVKYGIIALSISYILTKGLSSILLNSSIYIFARLGRAASLTEYLLTDIIDPQVIYNFALIVVLCYIFRIVYNKYSTWLLFPYNSMLLLITICALLSIMPQISTRLYICRFFFIPLFFTYLLSNRPGTVNNIYLLSIALFNFYRFLNYHSEFINIPNRVLGKTIISFF